MKIVGIIVLVVVLLGSGLAYVGGKFGGAKVEQQPTNVRVEVVSHGDLTEIVTAPGQVQPKTKVQISARVAARIIDLPHEEGATVKKGDLLVKLDATDLEAQLRAAQANSLAQRAHVAEAEARIRASEAQIEASVVQLNDAQRDFKRQKQMLESNDVALAIVEQSQAKAEQYERQVESSRRQLDADKLNLVVLQHQIEASEAEIARAKDNLNYTTILSPIDGIVTRLNAKVGELVVTGTMNNAGTVILEVSDLSQMQVDAQVDESSIASVKAEQKAKVRIAAYQDETFEGVVKLVGLDAAQDMTQGFGRGGGGGQGKWYRARIVLDTKGKQVPAGLSADIDIEAEVHKNVIKVPTQAIMGRNVDDLPQAAREKPEVDKNKTLATVVFTVKDGKSVITPVTIGASDFTHTVITSGLSEGDKVIIGPFKVLATLTDGQKVKEESPTTKPSTKPSTATTTAATTTQAL